MREGCDLLFKILFSSLGCVQINFEFFRARKDALKRQEESLLEHQVFLNALDRFMKV